MVTRIRYPKTDVVGDFAFSPHSYNNLSSCIYTFTVSPSCRVMYRLEFSLVISSGISSLLT